MARPSTGWARALYASFAKGDVPAVLALGTYSWNPRAPGAAEVKIAHVWTVDNGKITRFQQHVDTAKERYLIA
jgi:ketosteroid isomerase-like protein